MTEQQRRVLHAARKAGPRGVCQVDFLAPSVIDGGKPITRLPARIGELQKDGFTFRAGGWRQKTKVFVLDSVPVSWDWEKDSAAPVDLGGSLWGQAGAAEPLFKDKPANAIFGLDEAA